MGSESSLLIAKIFVIEKLLPQNCFVHRAASASISVHPVYRTLTTRIKGEIEKARKRAIERAGKRVSSPFGFVIPVYAARKSFRSDRSWSRHYGLSTTRGNRDRGEILSRSNLFAKHVTESGDEIPSNVASALKRPASRIRRFRFDKSSCNFEFCV